MASKNIKGITIEIGGNTSKLEDALKNVDKKVYSLNGDLKALNQALKLDPKNTELLAQKQDVLKRNIQETKARVDTLKEALRQMGDYNKLTDEQKESYNRLSLEIAKSESALKSMNDELKNSSKVDLSGLKNGLAKVGEIAADVTKKMLQVSAAVGGALAGLVTAGVKSYASLEQNLGGVETLFKNSSDKVVKNAQNAYKTAGMSANQYMETVTGFSASLLQSLGGDTNKAADYADRAIRDMSDNANKFGSDISTIQSAYQGFAKQNYNMLDNLKLGYGGNKTEMQRLIKDASKMTKEMQELGITVDENSMSFGNITNAISVVQKHLGVTGTTAKEANETISGSVNSMKAAFDNFLNGSGSPEALAETVLNALQNIANTIEKLAPGILKGVVTLVKTLLPQVVKLIFDLIPDLIKAVNDLIDELFKMITENTKPIQETVTSLIITLVNFITTNLPKIIEIALTLIITLAKGIVEALPQLIPALINCIKMIVDTLLSNIGLILEVAIELILALIDGLVDALPTLIEYLPTIIEKIVEALISALPKILLLGPQLIIKIIEAILKSLPQLLILGPRIILSIITGLINALPNLGKQALKIIDTIKNGVKDLPKKALQWGKDFINGIVNGIKNSISKVTDAAKNVANKIKNFLHFSRPDEGPLREYETWMPDFIKGLAEGIRESSYLVENASLDLANDIKGSLLSNTSMALKSLNGSISTSLNPTINPSVAYDLNYKLMAQAMVEALKEVKVDLDDRELGRFVDKTVSEEVFN